MKDFVFLTSLFGVTHMPQQKNLEAKKFIEMGFLNKKIKKSYPNI